MSQDDIIDKTIQEKGELINRVLKEAAEKIGVDPKLVINVYEIEDEYKQTSGNYRPKAKEDILKLIHSSLSQSTDDDKVV